MRRLAHWLLCWPRLEVAVAERTKDDGTWRFYECLKCGAGRWIQWRKAD